MYIVYVSLTKNTRKTLFRNFSSMLDVKSAPNMIPCPLSSMLQDVISHFVWIMMNDIDDKGPLARFNLSSRSHETKFHEIYIYILYV